MPVPRAGLIIWTLLVVCALSEVAASTKSKDDIRGVSEINVYDILAIVVMGFGLAMAASGGVGGGPIIVPLLVLVMGFDIKFATPASNFIIMGGAVANAIFNLQKRHPFVDRPLVDADICMGMIPAMMAGAVIGAFLSKLLPSYIISILFEIVLSASGFRTMQKGIKLHKAEVAKKKQLQAEEEHDKLLPPSDAAVDNSSTSHDSDHQHPPANAYAEIQSPGAAAVIISEPADPAKEQALAVLSAHERRFQWRKHLFVFVCYLGILAASIGGAASKCGSVTYWTILWAELPWVFCFTLAFVFYMRKHQAYKRSLHFPVAAGDIDWTTRTVMYFPLGCVFAGMVAGLFGVGGAIITGPLLVEMGVVPEVASSTSALLVLYSSAAASAKFALFGMIRYDWAGMLCALAFCVTIVAQVHIGGYVRRTGRQSIIVFCIGITICVGVCLMLYSVVKSVIDDAGKPFTVDFCNNRK
jgi:uncharacterized membrane protein YfcA